MASILKKYILPIFFVGVVFFLTIGHSIIENVFLSKMESGSGLVRAQWNNFARQMFYNNIIFGAGYKTARASSLFYSLLGELGISGVTKVDTSRELNAACWYSFNDNSLSRLGSLFVLVNSLHSKIVNSNEIYVEKG